MSDLNVMMREHARAGLQAQLDTAVTNGDTEAARKAAADMAKLELSMAPKAPPFTDVDVHAQLDTKAPWYGVDPKKSAKAMEFGKSMKPSKFASAEAFADAIIKAVEDEFKPAVVEPKDGDEEGDDGGEDEGDGKTAVAKKPRKTDGPSDGDTLTRGAPGKSGAWTKLSDAPRDVQTDIKRQADKFVPSSATKEQRESFMNNALASSYAQHQRAKGKK